MVRLTVTEFGGIDHLVTSVGGPEPMTPLEPTDSDWQEALDTLTMSVVRLVREAADQLRADGGGTIVAITSQSVKEAKRTNVLSGSVRMSVIGLVKTLSQDLSPDVRTNSVLPGAHETPRIRKVFELSVERGDHDTYEEARAARAASIPMGRIGDPTEFGNAVAFLSSPRSEYINGTPIPITGGSHAHNL